MIRVAGAATMVGMISLRTFRPPALGFLGPWVAWSLAGLTLGILAVTVIMIAAAAAISGSEESDLLFAVVLGAGIGGGLGLAQQRVLRRHLPGAPWAPATIVGLLAGTLMVFVVVGDDKHGIGEALEAVLHALAVGTAMGLAQRHALLGHAAAARWPLTAIAVWLSAEALGRGLIAATGSEELGLTALFLSAQVLTGAALARVLKT